MFRFKPATQFAEQYHNTVSCALKEEDLILSNFCNSVSNKEISNAFSAHFTNKLTEFLATLQ